MRFEHRDDNSNLGSVFHGHLVAACFLRFAYRCYLPGNNAAKQEKHCKNPNDDGIVSEKYLVLFLAHKSVPVAGGVIIRAASIPIVAKGGNFG